jgi:hypothetical protein
MVPENHVVEMDDRMNEQFSIVFGVEDYKQTFSSTSM